MSYNLVLSCLVFSETVILSDTSQSECLSVRSPSLCVSCVGPLFPESSPRSVLISALASSQSEEMSFRISWCMPSICDFMSFIIPS